MTLGTTSKTMKNTGMIIDKKPHLKPLPQMSSKRRDFRQFLYQVIVFCGIINESKLLVKWGEADDNEGVK